MGRRRRLDLGILLPILCCALCAPVGSAPTLGLDGPEVVKLDRNTRALTAADIDANGRMDLLLINNDKARIEILYQLGPDEALPASRMQARPDRWTPVLDASRFRRQGVTTGDQMLALVAADFDGDGRADLAYSAQDRGLVVRFQQADGDWDRRWSFDQETPSSSSHSLLAADLDQDGRQDLVMLGKTALLVFHQQAEGGFQSPQRYPLAEDNSYAPLVQDLDRDGRPDLIYLVRNSDYALRVRLQDPEGRFGAERVLRLHTPRGALAEIGPGAFAAIDPRTGLIEGLTLGPAEARHAPQRLLPTPRVQAVPGGVRRAEAYALADFDGDGRRDLLAADTAGARLWLYRQTAPGRFAAPVSFPAFADVRALAAADIDGDARAEIFLASPKEEVFGITRYSAAGRIEYPAPLPIEGKPLGIAVLRGAGGDWLLACWVEQEQGRRLLLLAYAAASDEWSEVQSLDLDGLRTDPEGARAVDFDQDGVQDLILFVPRSPAVLLRQDAQGRLARVEPGGGLQSGLLDDLTPGDLSQGDIDGDGRPELLIADQGLVRAVRLDAAGRLEVADQFNLDNREAEVASALLADLDQDGAGELLLFPKNSDSIHVQRQDEQGVYRPWRRFEMGRIELLDTRVLGPAADSAPAILYLGKERFWVVAPEARRLAIEHTAAHESGIEDLDYGLLASGDLNGDGAPELIALDNRGTRILEVLYRTDAGWRSGLHFAVFDNPADNPRGDSADEPREMLVRDLTGDGKDDIALLVHDRVLVYPAR